MHRPTRVSHDIGIKHNIEVAHRLFELPGKCEQIHGHSMWIQFWLEGELNQGGILNGIEFGDLKKTFRGFLDTEYDHRVLLNRDDPFASDLRVIGDAYSGRTTIPGLQVCPGDPTTENIAMWVAEGMKERLGDDTLDSVKSLYVEVWETSVNCASYHEDYS